LISFDPVFLLEADGGDKDDFILSENEATYSKLFVYGQASFVEDRKKAESFFSLEVDEKKGVRNKNGVMAKGDDVAVPYMRNLHRIAVIKKDGSLYHTLLKLISEKYRESDVYGRVRMAKDLKEKLGKITDLEDIAKKINYGIEIKGDEKKIYNKDSERWIMIHRTTDGEYEPIIYMDDRYHYTFDKDSHLLA
jgi:hypothetical protein